MWDTDTSQSHELCQLRGLWWVAQAEHSHFAIYSMPSEASRRIHVSEMWCSWG
jgi:hypothetical protein